MHTPCGSSCYNCQHRLVSDPQAVFAGTLFAFLQFVEKTIEVPEKHDGGHPWVLVETWGGPGLAGTDRTEDGERNGCTWREDWEQVELAQWLLGSLPNGSWHPISHPGHCHHLSLPL